MTAASLSWDGRAEVKPRADNSRTNWIFLPLRTGRRTTGLLGFTREEAMPRAGDRRHLLEAIADQTALAIERVHLVAELERAKRTDDMERLRSALLNSVSHDLGTPLAIIRGSAESLRDRHLQGESGVSLVGDIIDECDTLNRFIGSLLDMTKLDSGAIVPKFGLNDVRDIVAFALQLSKNALTNHRVELQLDLRPMLVYVDPVLLERALANLLDNAAKYAPQGTTIGIQSAREGDRVCLRIFDQGKGIPPADFERIFDKFCRLESGERAPAGSGLGLAIARGFVEAVGGTITAANRHDGVGAVFTITLPVGETAKDNAAEERMVSQSNVGE
jgi:two-component system, OmpR family, sensor histidine kinase KdpD